MLTISEIYLLIVLIFGYDSNKGYATQPVQPSAQAQLHELESFISPTSPIPPKDPNTYLDPEDLSNVEGFNFNDESIRKGFIRKVLGILSAQLMVTLSFVILVTFEDTTRGFVHDNLIMLIVAVIIVIGSILVMVFWKKITQKSPTNLIVLGAFTLAETYLVGASTSQFDPDDVLLAIGFTTVAVVALAICAVQTKWDFTLILGVGFVSLIIFSLAGIIAIFISNKLMTIIHSTIGVILFSIYLIYDIQMMIKGEYSYSISPEEYIFAALNLYTDIINLFLHILKLIGERKK